MDRHNGIETVQDNKIVTDGQYNVTVPAQFDENHLEMLDTLAHFQEIWGGLLADINMTKHRIELTAPSVGPIICSLYHVEPKAPDIEMVEIDKMLGISFGESSNSEWASTFVFAQKRTVS